MVKKYSNLKIRSDKKTESICLTTTKQLLKIADITPDEKL